MSATMKDGCTAHTEQATACTASVATYGTEVAHMEEPVDGVAARVAHPFSTDLSETAAEEELSKQFAAQHGIEYVPADAPKEAQTENEQPQEVKPEVAEPEFVEPEPVVKGTPKPKATPKAKATSGMPAPKVMGTPKAGKTGMKMPTKLVRPSSSVA